MSEFDITWKVEEIVNGPGRHDGGVRDKDRFIIADGKVVMQGESEKALRSELTKVLEQNFPRHAVGSTYDLYRIYHIEITDV